MSYNKPPESLRIVEIRRAIADYMASEGCDCCRSEPAHGEAETRIALLLNVRRFADGSGFDFSEFRSKKP